MTPLENTPDNPLSEKALTWQSHLGELRARLIWSVATLLVTTLLAFNYALPLVHLLKQVAPTSVSFTQLMPGEVFFAAIRLSLYTGVGLSMPVLMYHIIRFVSPGLKPKERRLFLPFLILVLAFFVAGVVAGYSLVLPLMLGFLFDYGADVAQTLPGIANYLNFCTGFLFATGLIFELPVALLLAQWLGLLTVETLSSWWRSAIVASVVVSAVITPSTDPLSQMVMAALIMGLYGVSIVLLKCFGRRRAALPEAVTSVSELSTHPASA